jgi:Coenzyme PQQ synthesis protein D (PqqD)
MTSDIVSRRPMQAPGVSAQTLDGETVLLNVITEDYYSLDDVGSRIWELLDGQHTVAEIVATITTEYAADQAEVTKDVRDLLDDLVGEGLVTWGAD